MKLNEHNNENINDSNNDNNNNNNNNRFKRIRKAVLIFLAALTFFFGVLPKNENHQVEASITGTVGTGATLASIAVSFPAVYPVILVGFFGILLVGAAYENWDDIYAFGTAVSNELKILGHQASDFVSGSAVTMNLTLRNAINKAYDNLGDDLLIDKSYGNHQEIVGTTSGFVNFKEFSVARGKIPSSGASVLTSRSVAGSKYGFYVVNDEEFKTLDRDKYTAHIFRPFKINVSYTPTVDAPSAAYHDGYSNYRWPEITHKKNSAGKYFSSTITMTRTANSAGLKGFTSVKLIDNSKYYAEILSVDIPALGIGYTMEQVDTGNLSGTGYNSQTRERLSELFFPTVPNIEDEKIVFNPDLPITTGLTVLDLPEISDKTIESDEANEAKDVVSNARISALNSRVGSLENGLNTIKSTLANLPELIVSGITNLFSWLEGLLENILTAILNIPQTITNAISNLQTGLENLWGDLGAVWTGFGDTLANIGTFLDDALTGMLDNLVNAAGTMNNWLSGIYDNLVNAVGTFTGAIATGAENVITGVKTGVTTITDSIANTWTSAMEFVQGLIIPLEFAGFEPEINQLKELFFVKIEFITAPINAIKNIFNSPRSLYDIKFSMFEQEFYPFSQMFKSAVDYVKPFFNGIVVFLTLLNLYRRFSPREAFT